MCRTPWQPDLPPPDEHSSWALPPPTARARGDVAPIRAFATLPDVVRFLCGQAPAQSVSEAAD